jgi:AcrR family transcriptional regulator
LPDNTVVQESPEEASHEGRAPGRPRSLEADRSILSAALDRFIEDGYQGMSIEHVAAQAGVGKATIYRRWPSKEALITDAVGSFSEELTAPDTGSVREDLLRLVRQVGELASSSPSGRCFARMAGEMGSNPELAKVYKEKVIGHRRAIVAEVISRGIARGELHKELDAELVIDMLIGPVLYRALIKKEQPAKIGRVAEELIDTLMMGIATRA